MTAWLEQIRRPKCDLGALMWLLAKADETGSTRISYRDMAWSWRWSVGRVQGFINRAEKAGAITVSKIQGKTAVTVNMLTDRGDRGAEINMAADTPEEPFFLEPSDAPRETKKAPAKGTRLPASWVLTRSQGQWAVEAGMTENEVRAEAAQFRDYWLSVAGAKGIKRDWNATWRNWIRRRLKDQSTRSAVTDGALNEMLGKYGLGG